MPPSQIVARHYRTLLPYPEDGGAYFHDELTTSFFELKKRGIGAFHSIGPEASFREVPLSEVARITESSKTSEGLMQTWTFIEDSFVYGMRIAIPVTSSATTTTATEIFWAKKDEGFSIERRFLHWWLPYPEERYATFWVYNRVYQLRINLDDPSGLYAAPEIHLLVPETLEPAPGAARPNSQVRKNSGDY
jgi:hypothetical protein